MAEAFDIHREMTDEELTAHFNAILEKIPLRKATLVHSYVCGETGLSDREETAEAVLDHSNGKVLRANNK